MTSKLPAWQSQATYSDTLYDAAKGIARITINRPERRNAFRPETVKQLIDAFPAALYLTWKYANDFTRRYSRQCPGWRRQLPPGCGGGWPAGPGPRCSQGLAGATREPYPLMKTKEPAWKR